MASCKPQHLLLPFFLNGDAQSVIPGCTREAQETEVVCASTAEASTSCIYSRICRCVCYPNSTSDVCNCPGGYRSTLSVVTPTGNEPCAFTTIPESSITLKLISCSIKSPSGPGITLPASWCTCADEALYATLVGNTYAENPCSCNSANFPATTVSPISAGCILESEGAYDGGFLLPQTWCHCGEGQTAANYPTITPAAAGSDICDYTTAPATELTLTKAECSFTAASTVSRPTAWGGCEGVTTLYPTPASCCDFTVAPTSTISTTLLVPTSSPTASCVASNAANSLAAPSVDSSDVYLICNGLAFVSDNRMLQNCDFSCNTDCTYIECNGDSNAPAWCPGLFNLNRYMCVLSVNDSSQKCKPYFPP